MNLKNYNFFYCFLLIMNLKVLLVYSFLMLRYEQVVETFHVIKIIINKTTSVVMATGQCYLHNKKLMTNNCIYSRSFASHLHFIFFILM